MALFYLKDYFVTLLASNILFYNPPSKWDRRGKGWAYGV